MLVWPGATAWTGCHHLRGEIVILSRSPHRPQVTTNLAGHNVDVNLEQPLILFVEVRQAGQAVSGARVLCDLQLAEGEAGRAGTTFTLELWDNGAGDPDMVAGDGVYS